MQNRLAVLLTNMWLDAYGGSEVVVRDLALGLLRRGHRPVVYSPRIGTIGHELADQGVAVIDDLRALGETPDIIHAHHTIPCGETLIRFPRTPAIYVCHAFRHWVEAPVHFPQVAVYAAVDEACRDRLAHTEGIDPRRVVVLPNAVDLRRVPERPRPLAPTPQRAIAFGKAAAAADIRQACARAGIAFETLGYSADRITGQPERELVGFDLVFGSARAALEALCCGCAVVACDSRGIAGLVTSDNFERLRRLNFGLRSLTEPLSVTRLLSEIERYDVADARSVAERARRDADLERQLDAIEALYSEVLDGARPPDFDAQRHADAVARFLHDNLPRRPNDPRWPWRHERDQLRAHIGDLEKAVAAAPGGVGRTWRRKVRQFWRATKSAWRRRFKRGESASP